jgi:predicted dehydrogenase
LAGGQGEREDDGSATRPRPHPGGRSPTGIGPKGELSLAVVGLGYWGPNLARNVAGTPGARLSWCCESDPAARERVAAALPAGTRLSDSLDELLADDGLDGVLLATPVRSHAELAIRVLGAGKHCFVEKPLAQSLADAQRVLDAAAASGRVLMVGHLLEYHPGVRALAQLIAAGELGRIHYIYTHRLNLGLLRADENALWSLGAHDVSVILSLAGEQPVELDARGECYMRPGIEDVVFACMRFPSGLAAHMHLSWLDPHKERRLTVVGSRRMATFDDMQPERKLTIYDKGFDESAERWGEYVARSGPSTSPPIAASEPLALEVAHFVAAVRDGVAPRSDGASGLRVVAVLEALQAQLERTRR